MVAFITSTSFLDKRFELSGYEFEHGDTLYVAQLMGGRLPEGTTKLPEGFWFKFFKVTVR